MSVLQIDAHADLREPTWARAITMRAPCAACSSSRDARRWNPQPVHGRSAALPTLNTTVFFDVNMRNDPNWIDRVVDLSGETVYITIDCDGWIRPSCRPWARRTRRTVVGEMLKLLRAVITKRRMVGCDCGAVPDSRHGGAELPLRQADLQILTYQFTK
jgi:arginase family enzyme